jgi:hypothetical protein
MAFNPKDPESLRQRIALLGRQIRASAARTARLKRWRTTRMRQLQTLTGDIPANNGGWHVKATRVPYPSSGSFVSAGHKLVWHTTEGFGLPQYGGSAPHFTFDPKTGKLYQHVPITQASSSLKHPAGTVETNHAHAIQVELMLFSGKSPNGKAPEREVRNLTAADYARIGALARWIEKWADVPRRATVAFSVPAVRMSPSAWLKYAGHCGHEHVPSNDHWDPGALLIGQVLK